MSSRFGIALLTILAVSSCGSAGSSPRVSVPPGPPCLPSAHPPPPPASPAPALDSPGLERHPTNLARAVLADGPLDGVTLGLFSQDPDYDYLELLREIREIGARWVTLSWNHYQDVFDSTEVGLADPRSAPWPRVRITVRQAHRLGFRVLLFPIVLMRSPGADHWRGTLQPTDLAAWHASYRHLITRISRLAAEERVDVLSVGSEFNSLQGDLVEWGRTIREVREVYPGAITYSANWDSVDGVSFIDRLDLIGMTTYFTLSDEDDPTVATLTESWREIREDLMEWRSHHGIPLLFTEVGFPSQDGANRHPWNYYGSKVVDVGEQRDCFEAFRRAWVDEKRLQGVFIYNWFGVGGPQDSGYTPRGKPARDVIRRWLRERAAGFGAGDGLDTVPERGKPQREMEARR